ncbi:hypothetical protein OHA77_08520 [Streptosporangium sp. NBC_01639]|uniref:hypothetical protein n=1 Tax=Streptosporangium sp. NBC_01639 TaxID=2975948 RepID=UPI003868CB5E|nr:hypothetical protein OHA77_08520 [Streptosporangium sp. NBC_01639]
MDTGPGPFPPVALGGGPGEYGVTEPGYSVERSAPNRQAPVSGERRDDVLRAREVLRAAFDRSRRALGDDRYVAELENQPPGVEAGIFGAFDACVEERDGIAGGLRAGAGRYHHIEQPGGSG